MVPVVGILAGVVGLLVGAAIVWLRTAGAAERLGAREQQISELQKMVGERDGRIETLQSEARAMAGKVGALEARIAEEQRTATAQLALMTDAKNNLSDAFKALSADALRT